MAPSFQQRKTVLTFTALIDDLREVMRQFPDKRTGKNCTYYPDSRLKRTLFGVYSQVVPILKPTAADKSDRWVPSRCAAEPLSGEELQHFLLVLLGRLKMWDMAAVGE